MYNTHIKLTAYLQTYLMNYHPFNCTVTIVCTIISDVIAVPNKYTQKSY